MGLTYSTYTATLAGLLGDPLLVNDPNFQQIIPSTINEAENRICREVDFLGAVITTTGVTCTPGSRLINWSDAFFVVESINVITPATATTADSGTRNPVLPATRELCNYLYPSQTASSVPQYFGRVTQSTAVLAPFPDLGYTLEITGTQRPTPLSASNTTTFISTYLPELMIAASMIYLSGYQQNFSAMGDNPQQATAWEAHYNSLLSSATLEESRKKFEMEGWSPKNPSPKATPPRV